MMTNPLDFSGKVALVTGAASGMGLATAQAFLGSRCGLANIAAILNTCCEMLRSRLLNESSNIAFYRNFRL
jgi:NAD(P)-dependent dehydrogenase (short-subunit alcohol dehydrogenase family)